LRLATRPRHAGAMAEEEKPEISGAVLRSYLEEMRKTGALDDVLARVPAEVRALAQKPPLPISWVDARLTNQLLVALHEARGREAVVELGVNITTKRLSGMLRPLLRTSLKLFGATPASFFSRFEQFTSLLIRGVKFEYLPAGDTAGKLVLRHSIPVPEAVYATWEGTFRASFALLNVGSPRVQPTRLSEGGRRGEVDLSW
jgi:hypothetical protein